MLMERSIRSACTKRIFAPFSPFPWEPAGRKLIMEVVLRPRWTVPALLEGSLACTHRVSAAKRQYNSLYLEAFE